MDNFTFYSPTYFAFGRGMEMQAGHYVKRFGGSKVLIHYGGGRAVRSGLIERVKKSLEHKYAENCTVYEGQPGALRGGLAV